MYRKLWLCCFLLVVILVPAVFPQTEDQPEGDEDEVTVMALPRHTLGDQSLAISAGLFIPLFFQEFAGPYHEANLSLGGTADLQWNAYLSAYWRIGLELAGAFCFSPNMHTLLMMPLTVKLTYLISVSRFEFPIFLGMGVNIIRYRDWSHLDLILKPGFGAYWRYDHNWSFGLTLTWWLDFQYADADIQSADQARMGNFLAITPSLFYYF